MKRIMMEKFGFTRCSEDDFSDDGNRFTCYRTCDDKVRVSKLIADGRVYISAQINDTRLPYDKYSKLAHYGALDRLNGVPQGSITDRDLAELHEACYKYIEEFEDLVAHTVYPTKEELLKKADEITAKRRAEYEEISSRIAAAPAVLIALRRKSRYEFDNFINDFASLYEYTKDDVSNESHVDNIYGTGSSFHFINSPIKNSYSYVSCLEHLTSAEIELHCMVGQP